MGEELDEHLGYGKHDPVGRGSGSSRNGIWSKMVVTDNVGAIGIEVPRDRNGEYERTGKEYLARLRISLGRSVIRAEYK